jgi:alpha-amylase/alpha-mannosidase (GH57 family)
MSLDSRFPVVLLWHMHQPNYRDALNGQYQLPWTYLHAIKDYVDMAAHIEANPGARAVVNFTPVLIEQLQELSASVAAHLQTAAPLPDKVLSVLSEHALTTEPAARLALIKACLRAHKTNLIARYAPYQALADVAPSFATEAAAAHVSDQFLRDLGVWFHLAWLGETVKRTDLRVVALLEHQKNYDAQQRRTLLELIGELLASVLPRYRALAERGQVELSVTPYSHPLMPLLIDFASARESQPDVVLPTATQYPGGAARLPWHLDEARRIFKATFGAEPVGCWPSEGAISEPVLDLLNVSGFQWMASGGNVLANCLAKQPASANDVNAVMYSYQRPAHQMLCLFRHDALSDLVGFTYSNWHADDAVANFVAEVERCMDGAVHAADVGDAKQPTHLLIALDGENAWEHYPFNGYYFLQGLYAALAKHPRLKLCTISEVLAGHTATAPLPAVCAGSWVHGTLATWIGDADKNRAWDLLVAAKLAVDAALESGLFTAAERARIEKQLAHCESSDGFWWFGGYNPAESVRDFDLLFRHQLRSLYELIRVAAPAALSQAISAGGSDHPDTGGVMRRANES